VTSLTEVERQQSPDDYVVICVHTVRASKFGMLIMLLNYSTVPDNKFEFILICKSSVRIKQSMINVAFKIPLKKKIGNLYS